MLSFHFRYISWKSNIAEIVTIENDSLQILVQQYSYLFVIISDEEILAHYRILNETNILDIGLSLRKYSLFFFLLLFRTV